MNVYGKNWKINGLIAAVINRMQTPGQYIVKFDRDLATIEQIEAIDWMNLKVECLMINKIDILPPGYSFKVKDITYDNVTKHYSVIIVTDERNFGDVKWYESEIVSINEQHKADVEDLNSKHKEEIVNLNAEHAVVVNNLETEIDNRNADIDKATQTITSLNTALADADAAIIQMYEKLAAAGLLDEPTEDTPAEPIPDENEPVVEEGTGNE